MEVSVSTLGTGVYLCEARNVVFRICHEGYLRISEVSSDAEYSPIVLGEKETLVIEVSAGNPTALTATVIKARDQQTPGLPCRNKSSQSKQTSWYVKPLCEREQSRTNNQPPSRQRLLYFKNCIGTPLKRAFPLALLLCSRNQPFWLRRKLIEACSYPSTIRVPNPQPEGRQYLLHSRACAF